jgi:putative transposase
MMSSGIINKNNVYLNRRSIRLKGYDYSKADAYFITICTNDRKNMFGEITGGKIMLNEYGKIINSCWIEIPEHFPNVELDEYIIMPNHVHGIVVITNDNPVGAGLTPALKIINNRATARVAPTIGDIIGAFKSIVANECLKLFKMDNRRMDKFWQRNYYEHIIRDNDELIRIREYIINNPAKWGEDKYNLCSRGKL